MCTFEIKTDKKQQDLTGRSSTYQVEKTMRNLITQYNLSNTL